MMANHTALPPTAVGLAALTDPADGLDRFEWMLEHGVESTQIALAQRFGLWPETLVGARRERFLDLVARFRRPIIHAPYHSVADVTFVSPSARIVDASLAELDTVLEIAAEAGIEDVVVHSGRKVYWMEDDKVAEILLASLPRLNALAERRGVVLAMETAEWLNASPDFLRLVVNARLPRVKLCLDVGHLLTPSTGAPPLDGNAELFDLIAEFAPNASVVHIHDTDGKRDHKPMGPDSCVDFEGVVGALAGAGYRGAYVQEIAPSGLTHEALLDSYHYLRAIIEKVYASA